MSHEFVEADAWQVTVGSKGLAEMKSPVIDQGTIEGKVVSNEPSNESREPGRQGPGHGAFESGEAETLDDATSNDFTSAELREFLAADHLETYADPGFKERLRKILWTFVRKRYGSGSSSSDSS